MIKMFLETIELKVSNQYLLSRFVPIKNYALQTKNPVTKLVPFPKRQFFFKLILDIQTHNEEQRKY